MPLAGILGHLQLRSPHQRCYAGELQVTNGDDLISGMMAEALRTEPSGPGVDWPQIGAADGELAKERLG